MSGKSWRERARESPRETAGAVGFSALVWFSIGFFRPRWLTAPSRRTWRQWLWRIVLRLVFVYAVRTWWVPSLERTVRAHSELREELGRDPTPEEQMQRMEQLERERS